MLSGGSAPDQARKASRCPMPRARGGARHDTSTHSHPRYEVLGGWHGSPNRTGPRGPERDTELPEVTRGVSSHSSRIRAVGLAPFCVLWPDGGGGTIWSHPEPGAGSGGVAGSRRKLPSWAPLMVSFFPPTGKSLKFLQNEAMCSEGCMTKKRGSLSPRIKDFGQEP